MSHTDACCPPPNNAGKGSGGMGDIKWTIGKSAGVPKRKSVTFDSLTFTYDQQTQHLSIEDADLVDEDVARKIHFSMDELAELRAALVHFGLAMENLVTYSAGYGGVGGGGGGMVPNR